MRETIKDIDFIIATDEPAIVRESLLAMDQIKQIIAQGDTKISVTVEAEYDVNIDFRLVTATEYATTLHHFTGSKEHNVALRQLAKQRGEKISEYGVEVVATNELLTFETESDFFNHFQLHSIPPEVREDQGELIAYEHEVSLVEQSQIGAIYTCIRRGVMVDNQSKRWSIMHAYLGMSIIQLRIIQSIYGWQMC